MSKSESFEDHTNIEQAPQTSTTVPLVDGFCNTQALDTRTSTSLWTYFRWILWAIFSGFVHCGRALALFPFDHRPVSAIARENNADDELRADCELQYVTPLPLDSATVSVVVNEAVCWDTFDRSCAQPESIVHDKTTAIIEANRNCVATNDSPKALTETVPSAFTLLPEYYDSWTLSSSFLSESPSWDPPAYTLLNSLYASSTNGLIDTVTFQHTVDEIVQSVIPRNLSDCSELTVCPEIRKLYAWNKLPMDCMNNNEKSNGKESFDAKSELYDSDQQLAYPGRLSMSDVLSPSLSPSTLDSSTTIGESPCASHRNSDIEFSFVDGKYQALTWAMSNLSMDNSSDVHVPQTQMPPSGPQMRQSRDKSPVSTVNSSRLLDPVGPSQFTSSGGFNLCEKSYSFSEAPKPKRSSSLKSQRTPPGTPEPKSVRFADALGLDLETVRHVFDQEIPPKIPASATFGLELDSDESIAKLGAKQFGLCFAQPGRASNFLRRVMSQTVCLEDAHVGLPRGVLTGTIRVRSLGFEKRIIVRITYNNWATYCDIPASYVQGSYDGTTDRFAFSVVFPDTMVPGDRAQFALRYDAHTGEQFWDNNHGQNYSVACYAKATDLAGDGSWVHYL